MDGATNGLRFRAYVADALVPALRPGDTVVMDNLALPLRHSTLLSEAFGRLRPQGGRHPPDHQAAGARLLYLPPYSPDFNPIENAFAKLKALLRTTAARTVPNLWAAIRDAFTRLKPDECRNYFEASGYNAYDPA